MLVVSRVLIVAVTAAIQPIMIMKLLRKTMLTKIMMRMIVYFSQQQRQHIKEYTGVFQSDLF